jgi:hypothetical protein
MRESPAVTFLGSCVGTVSGKVGGWVWYKEKSPARRMFDGGAILPDFRQRWRTYVCNVPESTVSFSGAQDYSLGVRVRSRANVPERGVSHQPPKGLTPLRPPPSNDPRKICGPIYTHKGTVHGHQPDTHPPRRGAGRIGVTGAAAVGARAFSAIAPAEWTASTRVPMFWRTDVPSPTRAASA